jgi:hypothetical protein
MATVHWSKSRLAFSQITGFEHKRTALLLMYRRFFFARLWTIWGQKGLCPLEKSLEIANYMFCFRQKIIPCTFRIRGTFVLCTLRERERVRERVREREREKERERMRKKERMSENKRENERERERKRARARKSESERERKRRRLYF